MEVFQRSYLKLISRLGKKVRLTEVQRVHITSRHKELRGQMMKIKVALKEPDFIWYSPKEENYHFYKWFDVTAVSKKYLLLVVKFLSIPRFYREK